MKRTYDFATIGFRPFPETQEFVTMGVVALDTAAPQFDFVLQDARKTGRVLAMFPKAGKALYREARAKLETELTSIRNAVNGQGPGGNVQLFPVFRENENGLFAAISNELVPEINTRHIRRASQFERKVSNIPEWTKGNQKTYRPNSGRKKLCSSG